MLLRSNRDTRPLPTVNLVDAIVPLSLRIVLLLLVALGLETVVMAFPRSTISSTLLLGLAKALSWYFTTRAVCNLSWTRVRSHLPISLKVRHTTWCVAAAIGTFSIMATDDPFTQSSGSGAALRVVACFFALGQTVHMTPKQATARWALWILILFPLVPYLANMFAIRAAQSSIPMSFRDATDHPVETLAHGAEASFENLLQRQSQSYAVAHDEYRRRYQMEPPPGFEAWYEFAVSHQSPIIDDFDTMYNAISPFWAISGKEVIEIMGDAQDASCSELWVCELVGSRAKTHCSHSHRTFDRHISTLFDQLLGNLDGALPNVKFLVNHLDEPRVLIPPAVLERHSLDKKLLNLTSMPHRPVWHVITRFCATNKTSDAQHRAETFGIPFITDSHSALDLCQHPEYSDMHGLFMGPTSFRLVEGLVPILSTGSPSTRGDILFPSPAYTEPEFHYEAAHDVDWDKKRNKLYWAGSTTGGFAFDDQWRFYHRQRFVALTQNLERRRHFYLRERDGVIGRAESSFLNCRLFDVAFTRIFQCERRLCRDQRASFNTKRWASSSRAFQSRLVFDMDGNGISGRYYKLLASKSVPLKQTILREWHDDRLMPWVHYIPVSLSMEELPELVTYLLSTETGQQRAKKVADQGRDWFARAMRQDDLSIYSYRLLIELARLQDPERPGRR